MTIVTFIATYFLTSMNIDFLERKQVMLLSQGGGGGGSGLLKFSYQNHPTKIDVTSGLIGA